MPLNNRRLLIVTQAVDEEDLGLGFFVRWIEALAPHCENIEVICLREGKHTLPKQVRVYSLGKERGRPKTGSMAYAFRFLYLVWRLRHNYDSVFVHMNQEYVLLAGWLWKLMSKPIYLWRNHYAGSWLTDCAAFFCTKIFCTSKHSYTAKYKKTILMPVGVDTSRFAPDPNVKRKPHSILFFARMSPSKRADMLLDALEMLARRNIPFSATFAGSPLPEHTSYYEGLKARAGSLGLGDSIVFIPGIPNAEAPKLYQTHEIFVNCSPSGMFDKMLFEAAACGSLVLSSSKDFSEIVGEAFYFESSTTLAEKLMRILERKETHPISQHAIIGKHGLTQLVTNILAHVFTP